MLNFKNKFILISLLIITIGISCKNNSDSTPNTYELFLEFKDENGIDLLDNFDVKRFKTDIIIKTDKGEVLKGDYSITQKNNKKILKILTSTLPDNKVSILTYSIQNEHLTGSKDKFILNTKWLFSNNNNILSELSINGTVLTPIKKDYFSYYILTRQ